MKDSDLIHDTLDDAIPPGLAEASLQSLTRAVRHRRFRSHTAAMALPGLALAMARVFLLRPAPAPPSPPATLPATQPTATRPAAAAEFLTDEKLLALFAPEPGVALAGPPHDRHLLVVSRDRRTGRP